MDSQHDQEGRIINKGAEHDGAGHERAGHESTIEQDALQRAREWIVFLDSSDATDADHLRFEQWLALDDRHRQAYQQASQVWQSVAALGSLKTLEAAPYKSPNKKPGLITRLTAWLSPSNEASSSVWPQWGMALASLLIVTVVIMQQPTSEEHWTYSTAIAEKRNQSLPDGTVISLSPKTRLEVSYSNAQRHVKLFEGEAFFDVAKNPQRPFIVDTRYTQVKVLGTMFNVNSNHFGVTVAVEEGKVQVTGQGIPGRRDRDKKLTAGQQISISKNKGLGQIEMIEPVTAGGWRDGLRIYQARPLIEVLQDLGRYHPANLVVMDEELNHLPITAVFPTRDVDQMLMALESILPINVAKVSKTRIEIRAR